MYADLNGPFYLAFGGSKYWVQIVDNASRMDFSYFIKTKDQTASCVNDYIGHVRSMDTTLAFQDVTTQEKTRFTYKFLLGPRKSE